MNVTDQFELVKNVYRVSPTGDENLRSKQSTAVLRRSSGGCAAAKSEIPGSYVERNYEGYMNNLNCKNKQLLQRENSPVKGINE